jgi:hypothetical protein
MFLLKRVLDKEEPGNYCHKVMSCIAKGNSNLYRY